MSSFTVTFTASYEVDADCRYQAEDIAKTLLDDDIDSGFNTFNVHTANTLKEVNQR